LLLIGTLPGMVETLPQRASPEPAATSAMVYIADESLKQTAEMNSPDPSHCVEDPSPDEAQANSDEVSAAQKGVQMYTYYVS